MNTNRAKKMAITSLIFHGILFILTIIYMVVVFKSIQDFSIMAATQDPNDPAIISEMMNMIFKPMLGFATVMMIIVVIKLIFYIIAVIDASNLEDNKVIFTLLIVGFFVDIVGIVALIMLLMEINKLEKPNNQIEEI